MRCLRTTRKSVITHEQLPMPVRLWINFLSSDGLPTANPSVRLKAQCEFFEITTHDLAINNYKHFLSSIITHSLTLCMIHLFIYNNSYS